MIKTLIVDDERLARTELKRLLKVHPDIDVIGEAANAEEALIQLKENTVELVFMDIQMPGMTGIELVEHIDTHIKFVFCTAYDHYAVDAFALDTIDYLVKPINPQRLTSCVQRVLDSHNQGQPSVNHYLPDDHGLLLKFGDKNRIVRLFDIERFESIGNHAAVYTVHGKAYIHKSLSKIEAKLDPQVFFKANRGDIVKVDAIEHIEAGMSTGSATAFLKSGMEVEISRRQAQQLKQLFGGF